MEKVMMVFGTRPEAIKMIPLIKEMEKYPNQLQPIIVLSGQHRDMLDPVLDKFGVKAHYDLNIMKKNQTLTSVTSTILTSLSAILKAEAPSLVLVHGDTTTSFSAALAAYYEQIKVGHIEAGLRTWKKYSPFPEEMNRQLVDTLSDMYFAPTIESRDNLLQENTNEAHIYITGNTAIDTMKYTLDERYNHQILNKVQQGHRIILMTMHRRENIGQPMLQVFQAIRRLVEEFSDIEIIFPVHRNPKVRELVQKNLTDVNRIHLIEPLDVVDFQNLAARSYLLLTDSGGVQEEAPSLDVPALVLRETTERPEGIKAGALKLAGTDQQQVYQQVKELLNDQRLYKKMKEAKNPYGDGKASERIVQSILYEFYHISSRPEDFQ